MIMTMYVTGIFIWILAFPAVLAWFKFQKDKGKPCLDFIDDIFDEPLLCLPFGFVWILLSVVWPAIALATLVYLGTYWMLSKVLKGD